MRALAHLAVTHHTGNMGQTLVSVSSSLLICILWLSVVAEIDVDPTWENVFKSRNDEDWKSVWHTERHRRCYHDLLVHMDWVCQKDIYAVKRDKRDAEPFIDKLQAHQFLGRHRKRSGAHHALVKRGIIDECCHGSAGCSWEEYAEYCPANSRLRA